MDSDNLTPEDIERMKQAARKRQGRGDWLRWLLISLFEVMENPVAFLSLYPRTPPPAPLPGALVVAIRALVLLAFVVLVIALLIVVRLVL